ncbi:MAG TPA: LuxR C-terminal-related transcriptional regulator [Gammaproteobacteria bacterium]
MGHLRISDFQALNRLLPELHAQHDLDALAAFVVQKIPALVASDCTSYTEINPQLQRAVAAMDSPEAEAIAQEVKPAFERYMHEHPLVRHTMGTEDCRPCKVSDFMSLKQWKQTNIYQEVYRPFGVCRQMVLPMPATQPVIVGLALNRGSRDFTERDRAILDLVRPHLAQAYRNIADRDALAERVAQRDQMLESRNIGFIELDHRRNMLGASPLARHALDSFFSGAGASNRLPTPVEDWLNNQGVVSAESNYTTLPLDIEQVQGRLRFSMGSPGKNGQFLITVERYLRIQSSKPLRILGLSDRETDVLYWIAQGKSNAEIAIILGISPRTVDKHLHSIYTHLGVETRTQAALLAIEKLMLHR